MIEILQKNADLIVLVVAVVSGLLIAFFKFFDFRTKSQKLEFIKESFESVVGKLSSDNEIERISAAILLRRFFDKNSEFGLGKTPYKAETINIIASILRSSPIGLSQKVLSDSLAFAEDLQDADLQKANLQNAYFGTKKNRKLDFSRADFFQANLSNASLNGVKAVDTVFYNATLNKTVFKNADLRNANFQNADLLHANFNNANLENAKFRGAVNIPDEIMRHLDNNFIYSKDITDSKITNRYTNKNQIFISSPGVLSIEQNKIVNYISKRLENDGFILKKISPENYSHTGQLSEVKRLISSCSGLICFGFNDIWIKEGEYRPYSNKSSEIKNIWVSTPWMQIEVAMASMVGLPVFILKDDVNEGVFDNLINETFLYSMRIINKFDLESFEATYKEWKNELR